MNPIDERIEGKLLGLHTAFLGQVVAVEGMEATVQPLNLIKQAGGPAQKQAVVTNVPILRHVKKMVLEEKVVEMEIQETALSPHGSHSHTVSGSATSSAGVTEHAAHAHAVTVAAHGGHVRFEPIGPGDIVFCVCADRDLSQTVEGRFATPASGHHQLQDAVIVGVLT